MGSALSPNAMRLEFLRIVMQTVEALVIWGHRSQGQASMEIYEKLPDTTHHPGVTMGPFKDREAWMGMGPRPHSL